MGLNVPARWALLLVFLLVSVASAAGALDGQDPGVSWLRLEKPAGLGLEEALRNFGEGRFRPLVPNDNLMLEPDQALWLRIPASSGGRHLSAALSVPGRITLFPPPGADIAGPEAARSPTAQGMELLLPLPGRSDPRPLFARIEVPSAAHVEVALTETLDQAMGIRLRRTAISGAFLAAILVFAATNLLFGFSLKQTNLFWYAGLLAVYAVDIANNSGVLALFTDLGHDFQGKGGALLQAGFLALAGGFTRSFLLTKRYAPRADTVLLSYSLGVLAMGAVAQFMNTPGAGLLLLPFLAVLPVLTTAVGVVCYRRGFTPAKFFILGWLFFFAGPLLILLGHVGFGRFAAWPPSLLMTGSVLQMLVFMLAVLDRVKTLREERFSLEKTAVRVNSALATQRRLFRDISHELRSPLSRLWLALEMIRRKTGGQVENDLNQATRDMVRIRELQDQMVTLAKLQSGEPWRMADLRLDELVREVVKAIEYEAEASGVELRLDCGRACTVRASRELVCRAVENVLRNAIRHGGGDGPVEVGLEAGAGTALLSVRDHGPGVPEEALGKLFDPYYTVDNQRGSNGLGIGLAIVSNAVSLHGGELSARNAEGRGLAISISLPLVRPEE